eukprot:361763-Chlamydomonas_euryale.AAC.3
MYTKKAISKEEERGSAYARSCLVQPEPSPQPYAEALRAVGLSPDLQGVARYARTSPPRLKAGQEWDSGEGGNNGAASTNRRPQQGQSVSAVVAGRFCIGSGTIQCVSAHKP